jgi:hypothetical protein
MIQYTKMCCHHYSSVQERVRKPLIDYHDKVSLSRTYTQQHYKHLTDFSL